MPKSPKSPKKAAPPMPPFEFSPAIAATHTAAARTTPYVRCRICCVSLPHLNFEWPAVPTSTVTLSAVRQAIVKRHGGAVYDLTLWRDVVRGDMCFSAEDEGKTLRALGVKGAVGVADPAQLPLLTIHYDFVPALQDDPICSAMVLLDAPLDPTRPHVADVQALKAYRALVRP